MRYAQIRSMDISNGEEIGVSLFVQGCPIHCPECFNSIAWDFNGGYQWTEEVKEQFIKLIDRPYIKRVSILGGEPLASQNVSAVISLVTDIRELYPDKKIWLYTGFTWEALLQAEPMKKAALLCDIVVDGQYRDELKDPSLNWRGSSNQRVIDVSKTLLEGEIVLYESNRER